MTPSAPWRSALPNERRPVLEAISVVVPTLGRPLLVDCLAALRVGTAWPARVIVVDQSRSESVARWVAAITQFGIATDYVPSGSRGRAASVNRGLERVATPFVAITDDDCLATPDWLATMEARLRLEANQIVTGPVDPAGEGPAVSLRQSRVAVVQQRPRFTGDLLAGGNMGTSRAVLSRVGMLDEDPRIATAEDREWAYRALRVGVPIVYAPEIVVRHVGWRGADQQADQYASYARSHGAFYGKYLRKGDWHVAARTLFDLARSAAKYARGVIMRDAQDRVVGRAFLVGLLPGLAGGLRR